MKAEAGEEDACRAHSYKLGPAGAEVWRGVITNYAAAEMPKAATFRQWLELIASASGADKTLPKIYRPSLQVLGSPSNALPGAAIR